MADENADFVRGHALYQHGAGASDGFGKAIEAFKVAGAAGHVKAQYYVGRMYHFGHGVEVDLMQAEHWYRLAAGNGDADACNNLGNVCAELGRSEREVLDWFRRSSKMGAVMGTYNMGFYYHKGLHGVRKDNVKALEWYRKTISQQPDYPHAWNQIGYIYEKGGYGVEADLKAAEKAYHTAIRTTEDKYSYYNLFRLYKWGGLPANHGPAIDFLKKSVEHGNVQGAFDIGTMVLNSPEGKKDRIGAAYYYEMAAEKNHGWATSMLNDWSSDREVVKYYGKERAAAWKAAFQKMNRAAREEVGTDLQKILLIFKSGDEEAAAQALEEASKRWKSRTIDGFFFWYGHPVWNHAQVGTGRENAEWGRFLFGWLTKMFERERDSQQLLMARINFNEKLVQLGRYGMLRQSCVETKRFILEMEGVDVDAVLKGASINPGYEVKGGEKFPMQVDFTAALRNRSRGFNQGRDYVSPGAPVGGAVMSSLLDLATERLSVGDWESVLKLSDWLERWNIMVEASGKEPERAYPGCAPELDQASVELKVDAFSALGLPESAAAACQVIIGQNHERSYGGRRLHTALHRLAGIRVDQGRATEVDLEELRTLEKKMRANRLDRNVAWQFAKLVRARVLAVQKGPEEGYAVVNEVLSSAKEVSRPLLRLEALQVLAKLKLDAGTTEGVSELLEEALTWARGNGLLFQELRIYEQYVRYLLASGDVRQALEMQRRVLDLIDALKLSPRRDRAVLSLAEIYALLRDEDAIRVLLEEIKDPTLANETRALLDGLEKGGESPVGTPVIVVESVSLQPKGIQTIPLRDQAEAIFILTNPDPGPRSVDLTLRSKFFSLAATRGAEEVAIRCRAGAGEHELSLKLELPGESQLPVTLAANDFASIAERASVELSANVVGEPSVHESQWVIRLDGEDAPVAVVDAARLRNSAFFLIPVYHHLSTPPGGSASVNLRVVASEPTRVEGYAPDGALLFVDAQGNGSFSDPGDLLATPEIQDLFPVLTAGEEDGMIGLRYLPDSRCSKGRVEIKIQTKPAGEQDVWKSDAIDWLEP